MNRRARRKMAKRMILMGLLVMGVLGLIGGRAPVSALTYQQDIGVNFTFNSTLQLTLSSVELIISDLIPGTSADSNVITLNVVTNNAAGYTLNATVGNNTIYNTRNLVHKDSNQTANFASVTYGSSIASKESLTDDTWAYAYSTDAGSTWANYSGLPLYSDTTNIATIRSSNGPAATTSGDNVEFKIAAKASSSQVAGDYNNVINFALVATPVPTSLFVAYADAGKTQLKGYFKMQDMNSNICNAVEAEDDQLQVIDIRDEKVYWIAKLRDGHCWMTQNLDLDLDNTKQYTHADTDLGWGSDSATTTWTPTYSTIHLNADGKTFSSMGTPSGSYGIPKSLDVGDWYYAGYDGTNLLPSVEINYLTSENRVTVDGVTTVNNGSGVDYFSTAPFAINGMHGSLGNYYNWSAAVASNSTTSYVDSTYNDIANNPQNSICPAGWRLPTTTGASPTYSSPGSGDEFARLIYLYNGNRYVSNSSAKLEEAPLFFARAGNPAGASLTSSGYSGAYWSSTVSDNTSAYYLSLNANSATQLGNRNRYYGYSVRCVAR